MLHGKHAHVGRMIAGIALLFAVLIAPSVYGASAVPTEDEQALMAVERNRLQAHVAADTTLLTAGYGDDLVYIHGYGGRQTKAEYLAGPALGRWMSLDIQEQDARIYGDFAITHSLMTIVVRPTYTFFGRSTGVYIKRKGAWEMISWQSNPEGYPKVPPPTPPAQAWVAVATAPAPTRNEQQLMDQETRRLQAYLTGTVHKHASTLGEDLVYIHAMGGRQTKEQYLQVAGNVRWHSLDIQSHDARVYDDFAVTHALLNIAINENYKMLTRSTGVYAKRKGGWQLVSWQSSPVGLPASPPPPLLAPTASEAR